ncbi:hypothetical protein C8K30_11584 [Promicromonospora sp. AC04]|uniref:hypothetical protein n=1 Tax=Promicromonospora sp. AC04 TaxID=2135723 RepID=UPI000D4CC059|nr:hypothetical protein [Promicromonospora sp. AC04]PUB20873.1 hypothetical protein C8K30_11584 [Promicromonospora sp. AC04]
MDNNTSPSTRAMVARQAGSLSLALWHDGAEPDALGGYRHRYAYRIASTAGPGIPPVDGRDIHSGVGDDVDTTRSMGTLVSLLSAAGEAYRYDMDHPGGSENLGLFPGWVPEAAYLNSDELTMLAIELENPSAPEEPGTTTPATDRTAAAPTVPTAQEHTAGDEPAWPPGRYYSVVFLQDEEGHAVVDLLEQKGTDAVIKHLTQRDFGSDTLDAALFNTEVYSEVPVYPGTRVVESGPYVLTYHPGLGSVHLLRELPASLERPASWPERYTGIPTSQGTPTAPTSTAEADRSMPQRSAPSARATASFDDGVSL